MGEDSARAAFVRILRKALTHLYDPSVLRRNPLIQLFDLDQRADAVPALRNVLNSAIESLKPDSDVPPESSARRVYHILSRRYTEQSPQREVANDLAVSIRQLRRQEKAALEVLADYLWAQYNLEDRLDTLDLLLLAETGGSPAGKRTPSREQELAWLARSMPSEPTDIREIVQGVLRVVHPLVDDLGVSLGSELPDTLPAVAVQLTTMRQALVNILTMAARCVPQGHVNLSVRDLPRQGYVHLHIAARSAGHSPTDMDHAGDLEMARRLIRISEGFLDVQTDVGGSTPFTADIRLPTTEQIPVLVIDDNVDTLRLMQRYLAGSRYSFTGASDPHKVFELVEQEPPGVIVLDVMLPDVDGWELLGRLREHPNTQDIPIIVCTILSQEHLAMTLGATEFLRKPVNQEALLSALGRQIAPWSRKPR